MQQPPENPEQPSNPYQPQQTEPGVPPPTLVPAAALYTIPTTLPATYAAWYVSATTAAKEAQ